MTHLTPAEESTLAKLDAQLADNTDKRAAIQAERKRLMALARWRKWNEGR